MTNCVEITAKSADKHEWTGLDINEVYDISEKVEKFCTNNLDPLSFYKYIGAFAVAIESKLKEKNT
jgi:hypothetical protein